MNISNHSHSKVMLSEQRDFPLLAFLWRWKCATTSAIAKYFYSHSSVNAAYLRLWKLKRAGFIRIRTDDAANFFVWTLDKKGFAVIQSYLPQLKEEGYMSENLRHDLVCMAVHLGDRIFGEIPELKFFSEQELRRIDPNFYPEWIPKTNRHRPDAYWRVTGESGQKVIALEVELSLKDETTYESVARFYKDHTKIDEILWVVSRPGIARKVQSIMDGGQTLSLKHSFVLLDFIYATGWQTPLHSGKSAPKTISEILETEPLKCRDESFGTFSFDVRRTPQKSKHCRFFRLTSFSH
jgi:hypothetical protein